MATRVDSSFNLGSNYQGRILVTDTENVTDNSSSVRFRVYVRKTAGTGYWNNNAGTRSWSVSGISGASGSSGSSSYDYRTTSGVDINEWVEIGDFTRTIDHQTSGYYYDSSFSTSISHADNPPGSGSRTNSLSLTNYPEPSSSGFSTSSITSTSAQMNTSSGSNGNGTSRTLTYYYRLGTSGGYTNAGSVSANGDKAISGLNTNSRYQWYVKTVNNTGNSSTGAVQTFITKPAAPVIGSVIELTPNKATIATTQSSGGGYYSITKQYRLKETGGAYGSWITYTGNNIELTDLSSFTDYTLQVQSVSSAGTTVGSETTFKTKRISGNFMPLLMG